MCACVSMCVCKDFFYKKRKVVLQTLCHFPEKRMCHQKIIRSLFSIPIRRSSFAWHFFSSLSSLLGEKGNKKGDHFTFIYLLSIPYTPRVNTQNIRENIVRAEVQVTPYYPHLYCHNEIYPLFSVFLIMRVNLNKSACYLSWLLAVAVTRTIKWSLLSSRLQYLHSSTEQSL